MPEGATSVKAGSSLESAFAPSRSLDDRVALWLVRHGETEWSKAGRHTGRTDLELTAEGQAEALALRPLLADLNPALVLCSPRRRALETARLAGLSIDDIDDDLAEWDYGDYEGRTSTEIRQEVPGWTLWKDGVPGGETAAEVARRADRVLARAVDALERGPVVLVAHGHISRVIAARWIGLGAQAGGRLALSTAAPSVLGVQQGTPAIDRWNMPNPAHGIGSNR
jgi:broad specificity phosphatase PhoE